MNYFRARKAEQVFCKYKELTLQYWQAQPAYQRDQFALWDGAKRAESEESLGIRAQLNLLFPEANELTHELRAPVTWLSHPTPAGGSIIRVNALWAVFDPDMGHRHMEHHQILDMINAAIGTAETVKKLAFRRIVLAIGSCPACQEHPPLMLDGPQGRCTQNCQFLLRRP